MHAIISRMGQEKHFTEEQKKLFEKSGAKNDWKVGLFFIFVFLAIIGINIFCRYNDHRKLEEMEFAEGIVTSSSTREEWIGNKRRYVDSITVEYIPEGSDTKLHFYDSDGPYEFIHQGDVIGVYYEKRNPDKAIIAKTDWITKEYVRADINYEAALIVSVFPLGIGIFFFAEELTVRKNIRKGKFKLKKGDGLYPDENLHELSRMSNYKRSWNGAWIGLLCLYAFFMFMGIAWIVISLTSNKSEDSGFLIGGIIVVILAQGCPLGIFLTMRSIFRKKRNFIKGFMADDATRIYKDREKAAGVLWKHVKHFMEAETAWSRYKYDYSRLWLEKYEDKLEKFLDHDAKPASEPVPEKEPEVPFPSTNHIITHPDMWSDITVNEIPKYLRDLAKKHNMHFKLITNIEMAMFNEKCCLIFGIDRDDGVIMSMTFLENGRRVEYPVNNYLVVKFDDSDREGIDFEWNHISKKIRNELIILSRGLDSKWSSLLEGDMSWFDGFKRSPWCHERHCYIEERNKILDEIIAWQQGQLKRR